jgi:putative aldouronate transport system substrate-binding protein
MKNWKFIFVVSLLIFSQVLTACSPKTATPTEETVLETPETPAETAEIPEPTAEVIEPTTEAPEPAPPPEPVDITLWAQATVTESGPPPDDWVVYDILRDELNINLEYVIIPPAGDGETKLNAAAAANDLPDLFQITSSTNGRDNLYQYYQLGLIAPVDDMFAMMPERTANHYNNQILLDLVSFDGSVYGLPEPPIIPKREGFVIRQDWLDALGLEAPTTPEELLAVATAFTTQDPDGNGMNDTYGIGAFIEGPGVGRRFNFVFGAYGVLDMWNFIDGSASSFGLNVRDPQYYEAMQTMVTLNEAGVIDPDWPTLSKDEFRARWKQGRFGIMWEDFAALTNKSNYEPFDTNFPNGYWTPLPALTGPGGEAYYGLNEGNFQIFAVSQRAADEGKKEAIARMLEWIATDGYYLLGFGVEGVNFNLDSNGFLTLDGIDPAQAYNAPERQPYTQLRNQLVFYNTLAEISARYPNYTTASGREMTPIDTYLSFFQSQTWVEGFAKKLIQPPANAADFERFYNEGIITLVLGQTELTPESWAEFLAGLDTLGAMEYEAAAQQTLADAGLLK